MIAVCVQYLCGSFCTVNGYFQERTLTLQKNVACSLSLSVSLTMYLCLSFIHTLTQPHKPLEWIRPSCPGSGFSLNTSALVYYCYVTVLSFLITHTHTYSCTHKTHTDHLSFSLNVWERRRVRLRVLDGSKCAYPGHSVSAEVCRAQKLGQFSVCVCVCLCLMCFWFISVN